MNILAFLSLVLTAALPLAAQVPLLAPWQHQDIGTAQVPGKAEQADGVITVQGTMDLWGPADGCHLAWQPVHGDFEMVARVNGIDNPGGVAHAKASLCLRESLDPGSRAVTLCVTPHDGVQFLYRNSTGGKTNRLFTDGAAQKTSVPGGQFPCWLKIVRQGNEVAGFESVDGENWQPSGQIRLALAADGVIGLAASSHKPDVLTKAMFDHVELGSPAPTADAKAGRLSQLTTLGIDGTDERVIYQTRERIEAPNWSADGKWLVYNSKGSLWRLPADGKAAAEQIPTGQVKNINNDHVLSPDGHTVYFSAGGHLYAVPFEGGEPRRISNAQAPERKFQYYLHGVSPDGKTLAYAGVEATGHDPSGRIDLYTIPAEGGTDTRLTDTPCPDDGPEYASDGKWIYFNSELNAKVKGHSQCYRMAPDGSGIEQLTSDERVNWFPHISPDRQWIVYLSFPPGTEKHPANKDIVLRRMRADGKEKADLTTFNGGQGTINVNSWSPDSKRFAFVMYPTEVR